MESKYKDVYIGKIIQQKVDERGISYNKKNQEKVNNLIGGPKAPLSSFIELVNYATPYPYVG